MNNLCDKKYFQGVSCVSPPGECDNKFNFIPQKHRDLSSERVDIFELDFLQEICHLPCWIEIKQFDTPLVDIVINGICRESNSLQHSLDSRLRLMILLCTDWGLLSQERCKSPKWPPV